MNIGTQVQQRISTSTWWGGRRGGESDMESTVAIRLMKTEPVMLDKTM